MILFVINDRDKIKKNLIERKIDWNMILLDV